MHNQSTNQDQEVDLLFALKTVWLPHFPIKHFEKKIVDLTLKTNLPILYMQLWTFIVN